MELVFRLISGLRDEVHAGIVNPPEDRQSEFHFGRTSGQLYMLALLEERLKTSLEDQATQQRQREEEF